jgi:hypothetical protein
MIVASSAFSQQIEIIEKKYQKSWDETGQIALIAATEKTVPFQETGEKQK